MRRLKVFLSLGAILMATLPSTAALAGSCECAAMVEGISVSNACAFQGAVNSQADCTSKNNFDDGRFQYTECTYCSDDNCAVGNGCTHTTPPVGYTYTDLMCTPDNKDTVCICIDGNGSRECSQVGKAECYQEHCWLDQQAMDWRNTRAGVMGLGESVKIKKPVLEINIPGVEFSELTDTTDQSGNIHIPYLGQYLAAIYKFSLAVSSMVAVIVIILNGFRIVVSAGGEEKNTGMHKIGQALTGLVILWGSYAFFYTINPELTQFKPLPIKYIVPVVPEAEEAVSENPQAVAQNLVDPIGTNLQSSLDVKIADTTLLPLQNAAKALDSQGILLYVTSGFRDPEKQKKLIAKNCKDPNDPKSCNPPTCLMANNDPKNCPHTTGKAVDVWGMKNGKQCRLQKECLSNPDTDPCRKDPCQKAVIDAMKQVGFCNLQSEAWHFELPKMSSKCI